MVIGGGILTAINDWGWRVGNNHLLHVLVADTHPERLSSWVPCMFENGKEVLFVLDPAQKGQ